MVYTILYFYLMAELLINKDYRVVDIDSLKLDPENAKEHDKHDLEEKMESLREFGFTRPLLVEKTSNIIRAGNGIYMAAKQLGYKQVPVIFVDFTGAKAKALGLSDNRLAENGKYNLDLFNLAIKEINDWNPNIEWKAIGFDNTEIKLLLESMNTEFEHANSEDIPTFEEEPVEDADLPAKPIKLTKGQREIVDLAIKALRKSENDVKMAEGRCLELICASFLSETEIHNE